VKSILPTDFGTDWRLNFGNFTLGDGARLVALLDGFFGEFFRCLLAPLFLADWSDEPSTLFYFFVGAEYLLPWSNLRRFGSFKEVGSGGVR